MCTLPLSFVHDHSARPIPAGEDLQPTVPQDLFIWNGLISPIKNDLSFEMWVFALLSRIILLASGSNTIKYFLSSIKDVKTCDSGGSLAELFKLNRSAL